MMMNSLLTTTAILVAICSNNVYAFAPTKFTTKLQQKQTSSVLSLAPIHDISFLVSDAADAIADAASSAVDTTSATSDIVEEGSKSFAPTYSKASYYTTLALYVASFPGLWSQIKRSTKAKVKRKTYVR